MKKETKYDMYAVVSVLLLLMIYVIYSLITLLEHVIYEPQFPNKNFEPSIDTNNIAYTCYNTVDTIDCYITQSKKYSDGLCVGCSNTTYFYRCYNNMKSCILIQKYYKDEQ